MPDYVPVSCAFHDRLEHLAMRRARCRVLFGGHAEETCVEDVVTDIVTADGAEFLILGATGGRVRLDTILDIEPLG